MANYRVRKLLMLLFPMTDIQNIGRVPAEELKAFNEVGGM